MTNIQGGLPLGVYLQGVCLRLGGSASRGDLHWGCWTDSPPSPTELEKQVNASYWNAFLFYFIPYVQSRKKTSTRSLIQPWELKRTLHDCQVLGNWTNAHLDSVLLFIVSLSDWVISWEKLKNKYHYAMCIKFLNHIYYESIQVTLMLLDQNNREHVLEAFRPDPNSSSFR